MHGARDDVICLDDELEERKRGGSVWLYPRRIVCVLPSMDRVSVHQSLLDGMSGRSMSNEDDARRHVGVDQSAESRTLAAV